MKIGPDEGGGTQGAVSKSQVKDVLSLKKHALTKNGFICRKKRENERSYQGGANRGKRLSKRYDKTPKKLAKKKKRQLFIGANEKL